MAAPSEEVVHAAAAAVAGRTRVGGIAMRDGNVQVVLEVDGDRAREAETDRTAVEKAILALPGVTSATVVLTAEAKAAQPTAPQRRSGPGRIDLPDVASIVAVASGKGGVGKSTVAVNLAGRAGPAGFARRVDGQRCLRALPAPDDGHVGQTLVPRRPDPRADGTMGGQMHVDRISGRGGHRDDLAGADGHERRPAADRRCRLGGARHIVCRHAPRHRRRAVDVGPARAIDRGGHRLDAPGTSP